MISARSVNHELRAIQFGTSALVVLLIAFRLEILGLEMQEICVLVSVLAVLAVVAATRLTARRAWSAVTAYLAVFVLFHFGLAVLRATGQPVPTYSAEYVNSWFNGFGTTPEALYVSALGCWVFLAACSWATPRTEPSSPDDALPVRISHGIMLVSASRIGAVLVILGTAIILGFVALTIPSLLLGAGGRATYWTAVEGSTAQLVSAPFITYGGILLAIGAPSRARPVGLTALGLFGVWALAVGARTAIMYTVLAMVVVLARRRKMPSLKVAATVFALGLVVVGFVGQARIQSGQASLDPRAGLAELGSSIRPVIEVIELARVNNVPPSMGVTYVSFASRSVERALGLPRPEGTTDLRIAGNEFRGRLDGFQIGYSAVAEAYRNGRSIGVFIAFALFGALLGRLDARRSRSPVGDFVLGVAFFALAFHIRQPSVSLVANVAVGLVVLGGWRILGRRDGSASAWATPSKPRGRDATLTTLGKEGKS